MKNIDKDLNKGEVIIYKDKRSKIDLDVRFEGDTVWLTQKQMAELFGKSVKTINEHIKNVFKDGELKEDSVIRNFRITASDGKVYDTNFYNLDVIISIGYRVKSQQGINFRIWATGKLKDYLINGYLINERRLKCLDERRLNEFKRVIEMTKNLTIGEGEERGVLDVIVNYADAWMFLQGYDEGQLPDIKKKKAKFVLEYGVACDYIIQLKDGLIKKGQATDLFGRERGNSFDAVLGAVKQSFGGQDLYPNIEDKASHLFYLIIKDHPFFDGNKRIASFLFLVFLSCNNYSKRKNGERKIDENTIVALALFVAQSDRRDKGIIIKLIMNFLREK
jgi:prophage maintenance system killer protein